MIEKEYIMEIKFNTMVKQLITNSMDKGQKVVKDIILLEHIKIIDVKKERQNGIFKGVK